MWSLGRAEDEFLRFFALSVTTSLKTPGAVIPCRVFTQPRTRSRHRLCAAAIDKVPALPVSWSGGSGGVTANRQARARGNSHTRRLADGCDHKRKFSRECSESFPATASRAQSLSPCFGESRGSAQWSRGLRKSYFRQAHRWRARANGKSGAPQHEERCTRRSVASATAPTPYTPRRPAEFL